MGLELNSWSSFGTLLLPTVYSSVVLLGLQLLNGLIQILVESQLFVGLCAILPEVE